MKERIEAAREKARRQLVRQASAFDEYCAANSRDEGDISFQAVPPGGMNGWLRETLDRLVRFERAEAAFDVAARWIPAHDARRFDAELEAAIAAIEAA